MVHELAPVGGSDAFPYLPEKPLIVVHEAFDGFPHSGCSCR